MAYGTNGSKSASESLRVVVASVMQHTIERGGEMLHLQCGYGTSGYKMQHKYYNGHSIEPGGGGRDVAS